MLKWLGAELIRQLIQAVVKAAKDWYAEYQAKQEAKKKVKQIHQETKDDPQARAQRMRDFLNK